MGRGALGRTSRVVAFNGAAIVLGLLVLDVTVTRLDLVPLGAVPDGIPGVGFASPVVVFGEAASRRPLTVAVLGDSHHEYREATRDTHIGLFLNRRLDGAGVPNRVVSLGTPRHAPIQELVAYDELIAPAESPDVAVFLLYGGNDLAETLRADDRPRAERDADGRERIAEPVWLLSRVPGEAATRWPRDSRLLYLANGIRPNNWVLKVIAANRSVEALGVPLGGRLDLIRNLGRFTDARLGYPGAVPAQFLNQAYLLHRHPEAFRREVTWRLELFFREFERRHPDTPAYLFFLPSAAGIDAVPAEDVPVLEDILDRTGLRDLDLSALEARALEIVREAHRRSGASFRVVDLSPPLRSALGADPSARLYDAPTLHIEAPARRIVAEEVARVLLEDLERDVSSPARPAGPGSSR